MEFLFVYGLFLAKAITIVVAIVVVVGFIVGMAAKQKQTSGNLEFESLSEHFDDIKSQAQHVLLDKDELKKAEKEEKKKQKKKSAKKGEDKKSNMFVLHFNGSMNAQEVEQLREEITAILCVASKDDEVLVNVESGGGVVHGYGLAASQLQRIKDKEIKLTVSVDKVAASGGYMMACVADHVISAPFAIIGSIGVIAQLPNFNKVLKKNDIEFEQHTAGDFKRTLTMFGENTAEGRNKFKAEIEDVHLMFKEFVQQHRPQLDIDKVATGEYWYGQRAKELNLVDELKTSDDFLMEANSRFKLFNIKYAVKKTLAQKLGFSAYQAVEQTFMRLVDAGNKLYR
ncbi:protease SohB [Brumicola nitratireducens]|uniref:Putative periplasmic protease n=1 Tax=Glaciecola nitratireducens (strain JCM 12485 / KCTC 12276 / FR1064) TaxID=1085623 RepID=G4QLK8_GLANF|nr:protease SohB [Glaciecola nitratireducens]AEP30114.1 putative periplasmic protease [Glaciecola nitratireducens FR1064]